MTPSEVVRLLGVAWVGSGLYPDPASQDAFRNVAQRLGSLESAVEIAPLPNGLVCDDEPFEDPGGALGRFAKAAFSHEIASIRIHPGLDARDLASFLQLVAVEPAALEGFGGLAGALHARDIRGVEVSLQGALVPAPESSGAAVPDLSELVDRFGEALPSEGSASFVEAFADVVEARQEAIPPYLEAFMRLPLHTQDAIVNRIMGESGRELQELFLGQLAGHELARLRATLTPVTAGLLNEYVAYSSGDRRAEAEAAILDPESLLTFRGEVAERIQARLQELRVTGFDGSIEMPGRSSWAPAAQETLRGIFLVERRPDRRERASRAWSRLVSAATERGAFSEAVGWLDVGRLVAESDPHLHEKELRNVAARSLSAALRGVNADNAAARRLVAALAPLAPDGLVAALDEVFAGSGADWIRKHLAGWLGGDPEPLLKALPTLSSSVALVLAELATWEIDVGDDARIRALLDDARDDVRRLALELCGKTLSVTQLTGFLQDNSASTRSLAFRLVAAHPDKETALPLLAEAIRTAPPSEKVLLASLVAQTAQGRHLLRSKGSGIRGLLTAEGREFKHLAEKVIR